MGEAGPLGIFIWMVSIPFGVETIGPIFTASIVLLPIIGYFFSPMPAETRGQLWQPLVALPAAWTALGLEGAFFWRDIGEAESPVWLISAATFIPVLFFVVTTPLFVWRLKGARYIVLLYSAANAYFLVALYFLASKAMTGEWF
jgi:hypothetical protein